MCDNSYLSHHLVYCLFYFYVKEKKTDYSGYFNYLEHHHS